MLFQEGAADGPGRQGIDMWRAGTFSPDYPEIHSLVSGGSEGRSGKHLRLHLTSLFLFNKCPLGPISNQVYSGI